MALSVKDSLPRRADFFRRLGWPEGKVFAVRQVHSRKVMTVDNRRPEELSGVEADGLISGKGNSLLTVTVADCLPIFLADPVSGAFAVVHSGWRGTGIVREAITRMRVELGVEPSRLAAAIGPGIGSCCYRVERGRYEAFRSEFGGHAAAQRGGNGFFLDLRRANIDILEQAGVEDVTVVEDCTACSPFLGSFRREGPRSFTRMLAFIGARRQEEDHGLSE
jgi:hypothetical protein